MSLLYWNIYEVKTQTTSINWVKLRGRIRKLCLEHTMNVLVENTSDIEKSVRFALLADQSSELIVNYLLWLFDDVTIELVLEKVANPVLSKLKVNLEERYTL